jgi:hypothetical protein
MRSARALAMIAVWLGGCSIAIGGPDAKRAPRVRPDCDTGKGLVKLDGATAAGLGVLGLAVLPSSGSASSVLLEGGALYAVSALAGNHVVDRCRQQYETFDREIALALAAPAATAPTPVQLPRPAAKQPAPAAVPRSTTVEPVPATTPDDPFHVAVGEPAPTVPRVPPRTPASAATSPWRDFWREVP